MTAAALAFASLVLLVGFAWCIWTATRLDRLHLKVEAAEANLRASLQRRSAFATELASAGLADPASTVLLMSAAVEAGGDDQDWYAQSSLTRTVSLLALDDDAELVVRLRSATRDASIARRIHNDLVARTLDLRSRRRSRWFRLSGHASPPTMVEFDDGALGRPGR